MANKQADVSLALFEKEETGSHLVYNRQMLDVGSYHTMENQSRPHVWINGSSLVYWLARHVEEVEEVGVGLYPDLALECHIEWVGVRGMRWATPGASCIKDCAAFIPEDGVPPKLKKYLRTEIFTCIKPVVRQVLRTFPL